MFLGVIPCASITVASPPNTKCAVATPPNTEGTVAMSVYKLVLVTCDNDNILYFY